MAFWDRWGRQSAPVDSGRVEPRMAAQSIGGGVLITTAQELEDYLHSGSVTASGAMVSADTAMRVAAVFACTRIRAGVVATMPLDVKRRVNARTREDASDTPLGVLLRRRPNRWQTSSQFRRQLQAHHVLRGNGYAMKITSLFGEKAVTELIPMNPDRTRPRQNNDLTIEYEYTTRDGRRIVLPQSDVFHIASLTLDGYTGVTPITYARETIGLSLSMEQHGASVFKNGARVGTALKHPGKLGIEGLENLKASLDEYRAGGENEGKSLILEEGMEPVKLSMSMEDAQWLDARKMSRTDIAMFMGVPPHMIGDTEKNTSWGTGIESQTQGFLTFTAEDDLTTWEDAIGRDLIGDPRSPLYARFNRAALVRADIKNRTAAYQSALQWGWMNPDEVRALEDMNPREDGRGGEYYDPPNTAGGDKPEKEQSDEPPATA